VVHLLNDQLACGTRVRLEEASVEAVQKLFVGVLSEGDLKEGSQEFISALLEHVDADFGDVIESESLMPQQCVGGDLHFFRLLLDYDDAQGKYDPVETLISACFSMSARIPLMLMCLARLELDAEQWDELRDVVQELVFDLCTQKKLFTREIKDGRLDLIRILLTHHMVRFDATMESQNGGGTIWSRACFDGDVELMQLLCELLPPAAVDSAMVLEDSTTPLLQSVFSRKVEAVQLAYQQPGASAALTIADSDGNTPRSIAELMQREDMLKILV